jgi:adenylate cyclase
MSANAPGENGFAEPSSADVRRELQRILESEAFGGHKRRSAFLRYVVEEALAGRAEQLKGVCIAMAVFDRDETFDQQTDPVVRLEARRLRHGLDRYYASDGRNDPIRISMPKGGYVPRFEWQEDVSPEAPATGAPPAAIRWHGGASRQRLWLGAAILAVIVIAAAWAAPGLIGDRAATAPATDDPLLALPKGPSIAVLPFLNLSGDTAKQYLSDGITEQLTTELAQFRNLWVVPLGAMSRYKDGLADPRQLRREFGVDYVLEGSVRASGDGIRITGRLIDAENAHYIWVRSFDEPLRPANIYEVQDAIAEEVAGNLAGKYGVLAHDSMELSNRKAPDSLDAYDCVLRYYDYQITINPERHAEVKACLEKAVALEPTYAEAWAVLANVYMQEKRFGIGDGHRADDVVAKARTAVERAVALDPAEPTAHIVLSNLLFTEGDLAGFREAGEAALRLNPNNSDLLAHFGLRLGLTGDWDRGLALANKAINLNPVHPQWYNFLQVFYHYDSREYDRALAELDKIDMPQFFWTYLLRAAALGQLDRPQDAKSAVASLLALRPRFEEEAANLIGIWQLAEPLRQHIFEGLEKAGLAVTSARSQRPGAAGRPS